MRRLALLSLSALATLLVASCQDTPVGPQAPTDDVAAPSYALGGNSHQLRATFAGPTTGFIVDPAAVAARCPEGFQWILQNAGSGEMVSRAYSGPFTLTGEHCSRWLHGAPPREAGKVVGKIGAGLMILTTPDGALEVAYQGTFVFEGDPGIGVWRTKVNTGIAIEGGTGVFAGASGHGHSGVTDDSGFTSGHLEGSLVYHD